MSVGGGLECVIHPRERFHFAFFSVRFRRYIHLIFTRQTAIYIDDNNNNCNIISCLYRTYRSPKMKQRNALIFVPMLYLTYYITKFNLLGERITIVIARRFCLILCCSCTYYNGDNVLLCEGSALLRASESIVINVLPA